MAPIGECDPFGSAGSRTVSRAMPLYVSNTGKVSECFFFLTRGSLTDGRAGCAHNGGHAVFQRGSVILENIVTFKFLKKSLNKM